MQKLAMNALGDTVVAHDDVLFCGGDSAEAAYFVQSGRLKHGGIFFKDTLLVADPKTLQLT